jgi:hypothetical protein
MSIIAVTVFLLLTAIAGLHIAWGLGLRWPARDERGLVALVIGATGQTRMPPLAQCLAAAAAIFAAGVVALLLAGVIRVPLPPGFVTLIGALVFFVFAGRGIAAYVPAWRKRFAQEPFARMDRTWYGPLCLLLAIVFFVMTIGRMVN